MHVGGAIEVYRDGKSLRIKSRSLDRSLSAISVGGTGVGWFLGAVLTKSDDGAKIVWDDSPGVAFRKWTRLSSFSSSIAVLLSNPEHVRVLLFCYPVQQENLRRL